MTIGYVGLGEMGGALAKRLQLERELLVYDRDEAAVARLIESGATVAASVAAVGAECEVVVVCLPTSAHVESVIFGADGLAGTMRSGGMIVDQTSGDPHATRAMAERLESSGLELIDAPVSGGAKGAEAGTIAIMVGASDEQLERAKPIFDSISSNVFHAGGVGAGHTIKLVNNLVSATQRLLTFEAMTLAAKNGVEPRTAIEIMLASGGKNAYMERIMGPQVLEGKLNFGFTLGLAHKDLRLACELGSDSEVPLFYGNLSKELYQMHIGQMGRDTKVDSAALVVDRLAGTQVVPEGYTLDE